MYVILLSSFFFPRYPFILGSHLSLAINSSLTKFTQKFGHEHLLSLNWYKVSKVKFTWSWVGSFGVWFICDGVSDCSWSITNKE